MKINYKCPSCGKFVSEYNGHYEGRVDEDGDLIHFVDLWCSEACWSTAQIVLQKPPKTDKTYTVEKMEVGTSRCMNSPRQFDTEVAALEYLAERQPKSTDHCNHYYRLFYEPVIDQMSRPRFHTKKFFG